MEGCREKKYEEKEIRQAEMEGRSRAPCNSTLKVLGSSGGEREGGERPRDGA